MELLALSESLVNTVVAIVATAVTAFAAWAIQSRIAAKRARVLREKYKVEDDLADSEKEYREFSADAHRRLLERVMLLESKGVEDSMALALLKQEIMPMAEAMKQKLIEVLTHPSDEFIIPDELLDRIKHADAPLTDIEWGELHSLLETRIGSDNPHVTEQEKLAAAALPDVIRMAELEAKTKDAAEITEVQLVSSTAKTKETKKVEEDESE